MDQLESSASDGLISKDTLMDAESCDIIATTAKPAAEAAEAAVAAEEAAVAVAAEDDADKEEEAAAAGQQLEAEMVEVNIGGGSSEEAEAEAGVAKDEEEDQEGGGGGGGKQKQRRAKKGFVQSLLGVLKKSTTKGFAATPPDSPQQSVSSKSFLRGLRPLISRIRKNDAPAATSTSSGSSLAKASYSDKDVQTAIREARDNLQGAHDVAEKIFSQNLAD